VLRPLLLLLLVVVLWSALLLLLVVVLWRPLLLVLVLVLSLWRVDNDRGVVLYIQFGVTRCRGGDVRVLCAVCGGQIFHAIAGLSK
jgi:hypothetical protein